MKLQSRAFAGILAAAVVVCATLAFAAIPYFFQDFETDRSGWYDYTAYGSSVARVAEPSASSSYNSGTTSAYANGVNAATGSYFARVKSSISSGDCVLDYSAPLPAQLLCVGPYTFFNLPVPVLQPFPAGGYSDQLDIYLDVAYAQHHPDCGRTAPCEPDNPGVLNEACVSDPQGLACEGTRFDWTLGVNKPNGDFLQDYVFKVGTAPAGTYSFCPGGGYAINAQYNSFRSGGFPYDSGWGAKCITQSGWYTFQQIFSDDGGYLRVDFNILNPDGSPATCVVGETSESCTWTRYPGHAIADVGCPAYGWFANEEINDLPFDNTTFVGNCGPVNAGMITPTNTTCLMYLDGTASTLDRVLYTKKGNVINSVAPGVFFYYTRVSGEAGDSVQVTETHTGTAPIIPTQKTQALLYTDTCGNVKWESLTVYQNGNVTGTLPYAGDFIIGVKYSPSTLRGKPVPNPATSTYSFGTVSDSVTSNVATVDLAPK